MREFFKPDGCLTGEALKALASGENLEEITRLEISEHLSFCDSCVLRYTELLSEETLSEPQTSVVPTVMERIKRRAQLIFFNRYVAAGLAACFALILWGTGFFESFVKGAEIGVNSFSEANIRFTEYSSDKLSSLSERLSDFTEKLSDSFEKNKEKGRTDNEKE